MQSAVAELREELGARKRRLRVGLVWSGNRNHKNDAVRSTALATLAPLMADGVAGVAAEVEWISLQNEVRPADRSLLQAVPIRDLSARLTDFADTAALVELLDLVISIDSAVAHLAGAMGRPVWILLPYAPDYRWLRERTDSPWYPIATLFRQKTPGNWPSVIAQVEAALRDFVFPPA